MTVDFILVVAPIIVKNLLRHITCPVSIKFHVNSFRIKFLGDDRAYYRSIHVISVQVTCLCHPRLQIRKCCSLVYTFLTVLSVGGSNFIYRRMYNLNISNIIHVPVHSLTHA